MSASSLSQDNNPRTGFEADAVHVSLCLLPQELYTLYGLNPVSQEEDSS